MARVEKYIDREAIQLGYEGKVKFDGASRPEKGLFADKLGFHMQGFCAQPPTLVKDIRLWTGNQPVRPMALRVSDLGHGILPVTFFASRDWSIQIKGLSLYWELNPGSSPQIVNSRRMVNADGDEVWYVHRGAFFCETSFGMLRAEVGDYLYIPRLVHYRICPVLEHTFMIGIESAKRLLKPVHDDLPGVPYHQLDLKIPIPETWLSSGGDYEVMLKRNGEWTLIVYDHPIDRIAYRGRPYPFVLSTNAINTVSTPTMHTDPSVFATFATEDNSVVVSTFKPRWVHSPPYYHMNEWDEFLFYAKPYGPRGGVIEAGNATFHPQGFYHGPQVMAAAPQEKSPKDALWVEDLAIMFETRACLVSTITAENLEIADYWKSWSRALEARKKVQEMLTDAEFF